MSEDKKTGSGALDAFVNLLHLATLGWFALFFGRIIFLLIDRVYQPEIFTAFYSGAQDGLKFAIASLIIVTPVFLGVAYFLHRNYAQERLNPKSGIRRWLTYLMLFVAALNIIGSLIALIYQFLNGDYTLGTILKIFTVLMIATGIFGYYAYDLRRHDYKKKSQVSLIFMIVVIVATLAAVIGGFFMVDSPAKTKLRKLDEQRVNSLDSLNQMVILSYSQNKKLPATLAAAGLDYIVDPATKKPYEYQIVNDKEFELCATFALATNKPTAGDVRGFKGWYYHDAGRQCFQSSVIDPTITNGFLKPVAPVD